MRSNKNGIRIAVAAIVVAAICLVNFQIAAQQPGQQAKQGAVSDDDFVSLQQQIRELKNPTFRAFLRLQLLSWESPQPNATRRHAAMSVATQGVTDLCDHQDEVWPPTASWLHGSFVKQIKTLQFPEETVPEICRLNTESKSKSQKDFLAGIKMLNNSETLAAGTELAKSAILSGQVSAQAILGQLVPLKAGHSPHLPELLSAVLLLEEQQPGTLPMKLMPFFSSLFLERSVPSETLTRFLFVAVRSTRLPSEELSQPAIRGLVAELLNGIVRPAQLLTPALYPEIATRLNSLDTVRPNMTDARLAAEERIQKATDPLEQLVSEAKSTSEEDLKKQFFFRAAKLAKERGQLSKAVDLAMNTEDDAERKRSAGKPSPLNEFLAEIVSVALKNRVPHDAAYSISKMARPLEKAQALRLLGEFYGESKDRVRSKEAFNQSAKQLKSAENSNEKVKTCLLLAESVLTYEPSDAYDAFRESVKTINNLPSPEKNQEKMYYLKLLPVADSLIRAFRLLAIRENQTATALASEIKLSELRLSALGGAYSGHEVTSNGRKITRN